jgi:hypothetical protein
VADTRECLACGHQNKPSAASCAACFTSLNLKLCAVCEAANALTAGKCHACGASLVDGAPVKEAPVPVAAAERLFEEVPRIRLLPLHSKAPARTGRLAGLWIVSVAVAAGGGYYFASRVPLLEATPAPSAAALHPETRAEPVQPAAQARVERITHTKAGETLEQPDVAGKAVSNPPAGCAPAVAALGLCPAR